MSRGWGGRWRRDRESLHPGQPWAFNSIVCIPLIFAPFFRRTLLETQKILSQIILHKYVLPVWKVEYTPMVVGKGQMAEVMISSAARLPVGSISRRGSSCVLPLTPHTALVLCGVTHTRREKTHKCKQCQYSTWSRVFWRCTWYLSGGSSCSLLSLV